jgi:hypothetical protein
MANRFGRALAYSGLVASCFTGCSRDLREPVIDYSENIGASIDYSTDKETLESIKYVHGRLMENAVQMPDGEFVGRGTYIIDGRIYFFDAFAEERKISMSIFDPNHGDIGILMYDGINGLFDGIVDQALEVRILDDEIAEMECLRMPEIYSADYRDIIKKVCNTLKKGIHLKPKQSPVVPLPLKKEKILVYQE